MTTGKLGTKSRAEALPHVLTMSKTIAENRDIRPAALGRCSLGR